LEHRGEGQRQHARTSDDQQLPDLKATELSVKPGGGPMWWVFDLGAPPAIAAPRPGANTAVIDNQPVARQSRMGRRDNQTKTPG
jgi:hypothetical protein